LKIDVGPDARAAKR